MSTASDVANVWPAVLVRRRGITRARRSADSVANATETCAYVLGVTITGGTEATQSGREFHVPKRDLVGSLQVLLQSAG